MKLTITAVLLGLVGISLACTKREGLPMQNVQGTQDETAMSWDSPRMLAIQDEWESLKDTASKSRGPEGAEQYGVKNEKLSEMLDGILTKHLSEEDLRQLVTLCGTLPIRNKDRSPFCNSVLHRMAVAFVISGDRDSLVTLLATRCPDEGSSYFQIEYLLTAAEKTKKLKYPILVLEEAYSKCEVPEVRHDIAQSVRRGFATMQIPGLGYSDQEDDDFVKNAMEWYRRYKDDLEPNPEYGQNKMTEAPGHYKIPLYVWKESAKKAK